LLRRLGLLALLGIALLGAAAGWLNSQLDRSYRGHRPERVFVDIPHGTPRWQIARILRNSDVIRSALAFAVFSEWHFRKPLQAGEYLFDRSVNSREVFWKIERGRIFVHVVTVPEGWTLYDIAAEAARQGICSREEFLAAARNTSLISDLAPGARTLEGFLFPSTYEFTRRTNCRQIAETMTQHFRAVWQKELTAAGTPPDGLTPTQAVTMASLVERETPNPEERALVAGVFFNRLRLGFPLQCDPTVQYAMRLAGHPEQNVRPQDLHIDSAYNTYEHRGLPPGPIANPGEASIHAALTPERTDYLYFVANDQGGHSFSRTLAEHNRNVARLRRLLEAEPAQSDQPPAKTTH
jgi:UPF0755 protein